MAFSKSQRHDIRLLALFRAGSYLGDTIALIALFLRLAPLGHAWAIAALAIAGSLPLVALAPLAGRTIDHQPAKRLLVIVGFAEAVVCVGIGLWHGLVVTLVLMLALSSLVAFSMPGYTALIPTLAGQENIERSQGLVQSAQGVAGVAGPALGGLLVGWTGQSWPLYIDAASFALGALATTLLHHDRRPTGRHEIDAIESSRLLAGAIFVWRDDVLRPIIVAVMVFMLSLGMVNVAEVFFATSTLHASALEYGLIGTSFGGGTVLGSLGAGRWRLGQVKLVKYVLISIVVVGLLIGASGLATHIQMMYPLLFLAGVLVGAVNVMYNTLFIKRTPDTLRGRVFAASGAMFTASEVAATTMGGVVLTVLAPRTVMQIAGGLSALSILMIGPFALRASRIARQSEREEEATTPSN